MLLPGIQREGFQAAETEIQTGTVGHRARKFEHASTSRFGRFCQHRATGITETKHFCGFIEGLAGGIVQALANDFIAADFGHMSEQRMTAGYKQRDERELRRILFEQRCQQMALHVVNFDRRNIQRPCHTAPDGGARQQRADQTGPGGIGDAVEVIHTETGHSQHFVRQRQQVADMVTRCQFGYDAAVLGVDSNLAMQHMRQQAALAVVDSESGFITGAFYAQNYHSRTIMVD